MNFFNIFRALYLIKKIHRENDCAGNITLFERLFAAISLEFVGCRFLPIVPRGRVEHVLFQRKGAAIFCTRICVQVSVSFH